MSCGVRKFRGWARAAISIELYQFQEYAAGGLHSFGSDMLIGAVISVTACPEIRTGEPFET